MTDSNSDISIEREELFRHILSHDTLSYCHERYPGAVRLELVRRTRAVLRIHDKVVGYHLSELDQGFVTLKTEASQSTKQLETSHPALWSLGLHIAAEAMLALRNGHKEYVRVKNRKKKADTR